MNSDRVYSKKELRPRTFGGTLDTRLENRDHFKGETLDQRLGTLTTDPETRDPEVGLETKDPFVGVARYSEQRSHST